MSADLFAEFLSAPNSDNQQQSTGSGNVNAQPAPSLIERKFPPTSFSFFDDLSGQPPPPWPPQQQQQQQQQQLQPVQDALDAFGITGNHGILETATDENDDWGDFEGGSSSVEPAALNNQNPFSVSVPQTSQPKHSTWSTGPTQDDLFSICEAPPAQPSQDLWTKAPVIKAKKSADPSVLFDAENDFDEDDDFGDFEGEDTKPPAINVPTNSAVADLLGELNFSEPTAPVSGEREGISARRKAPSSSMKETPASGSHSISSMKQAPSVAPVPPATQQDDSWDTFDDWEASIPTKVPVAAPSKSKVSGPNVTTKATSTPPPILSPTFDDVQPGELPPTTVPPPAVLLTLFPPLFSEAQEKLFKPMAAQGLPMRNKLLSESATIAYLQGYLMLASVAAHIIAGRKLRWKRDQHLSQGMRIGPASSRATSGMKLSSVDKSENMKEEREVSDVVLAWKDQVGRLRHVVSAANQIRAGTLGAVPDIQETMAVKVLKQGEGGVPAAQPCMMCGLKRDERVGLADQGVEDSFGEWWVDQVNMHRGMSAIPLYFP
jgi:hypothetical protein